MVDKYTKDLARTNLAKIIRYQRTSIPLTLRKLSGISGVSLSHLNRIERGVRFPSAGVLRKIAKPLGFEEDELFMLAGYLPPQYPVEGEGHESCDHKKGLDCDVARALAQQPVKVQRAIIPILSILRSLAEGIEE